MMYTDPTIADFKTFFDRDFVYGVSLTQVRDIDITRGLDETKINLNVGLFSSQESYTLGYLLLSAHYMVLALRASSQGVSGQFNFPEQSKAVGNVSQSFAIPQRILDNPVFAWFTKTNYGSRYLMMILPSLSGQIYTVCGRTQP